MINGFAPPAQVQFGTVRRVTDENWITADEKLLVDLETEDVFCVSNGPDDLDKTELEAKEAAVNLLYELEPDSDAHQGAFNAWIAFRDQLIAKGRQAEQ